MERLLAILLVVVLCASAGCASRRAAAERGSGPAEFHDVTIPGGTNDLSKAARLIIHLGDGKKMTIDLRARVRGEVVIFAGEYPPGRDDPMWHSLVIYPGAANVIRVAVESHEKPKVRNQAPESDSE